MKKIWKFQVPTPFNSEFINVPQGGEVIHVENAHMWIEFDTEYECVHVPRRFMTVGTGVALTDSDNIHHVGTFMDGQYVWHVYEERRD